MEGLTINQDFENLFIEAEKALGIEDWENHLDEHLASLGNPVGVNMATYDEYLNSFQEAEERFCSNCALY